MGNYFFCDNNEETIEHLINLGWESHIDPREVNDSYLMCFFNDPTPNNIFTIDLDDTPTKRSAYIADPLPLLNKYALLSSLGMSLQEIIDTCKE